MPNTYQVPQRKTKNSSGVTSCFRNPLGLLHVQNVETSWIFAFVLACRFKVRV